MNPSTLDIHALPSLLLTERSQLPAIPAIYFAIDSLGQIQYIGRSVNLQRRWIQHHRSNRLSGARIAWLEVDAPELLPSIEQALIDYFDPPLNGYREVVQIAASDALQNLKRMYCRLSILLAEQSPPMSQRRLALTLGLSTTTVNKLYNGRPFTGKVDSETCEKICQFFDCNVDGLFEMKEVAK